MAQTKRVAHRIHKNDNSLVIGNKRTGGNIRNEVSIKEEKNVRSSTDFVKILVKLNRVFKNRNLIKSKNYNSETIENMNCNHRYLSSFLQIILT